MEKTVEISTGSVKVRALTNREFTESKFEAMALIQELQQKYPHTKPEKLRPHKVKALTDQFYRILATSIVEHPWNLNGTKLEKHLELIPKDDLDKIEAASDGLNNLSPDAVEDLPEQSGEGKPRKKRKTKSS